MKHLALVLLVALFSSVATAGPPEYSGVVSRGTTPIASYFVDEEACLLATLGVDPVEFCSGSGDLDFIAWQDMSMSSGLRWATIGKGNNVRASVYKSSDFASFTVPEICEAVLSGVALPLATGEVNYRMQMMTLLEATIANQRRTSIQLATLLRGPCIRPTAGRCSSVVVTG